MPKKSEYDLPTYQSRTYRIPIADERMLASLGMLKKISDVDVYVESDPHTIGISKVTVGTYGEIPLPKGLGKYRHDYEAWKPFGELGRNEDIEYKIVKAGGKDKYGRDVIPIIKYRGTTTTFDQYGYQVSIPVEGEVSPEDGKSLTKDPQKRVELIQELIDEGVGWNLEDAMQEHPEWFGYGEEEEEENESYESNNPVYKESEMAIKGLQERLTPAGGIKSSVEYRTSWNIHLKGLIREGLTLEQIKQNFAHTHPDVMISELVDEYNWEIKGLQKELTIPMSEKEIREGYRAGIPGGIMSKVAGGFYLTEYEKDIVNKHGKVYVRAFKKDRGRTTIEPQLRNLPKKKR